MKYWEDFQIGERAELGRHTFTEDEIVEFGRRYDPQPFHVDVENARRSAFGGLIASGWQTCAIGMRLMVEGYIRQTVSLGSPGIDNIRWLKPVRPGDTISYSRIVLESRASTTRKGVGLVKHRWEAVNQRGELVLTMEGWGMFGRKD
ncbi:MAG TPA: MaoC family dehydratase [Burkholderiales bacterium]|jgi:acyl dehydratase|nr:MaoC family dehydratase [Burkholderiales bacterium]